jgi:hypothetical protein
MITVEMGFMMFGNLSPECFTEGMAGVTPSEHQME